MYIQYLFVSAFLGMERLLHSIDRFSFGNLLPVSSEYKKTVSRALDASKHMSQHKASSSSWSLVSRQSGADGAVDRSKVKCSMPDTSKLVTYKPGVRFLTPVEEEKDGTGTGTGRSHEDAHDVHMNNMKVDMDVVSTEAQVEDWLECEDVPMVVREVMKKLPDPSRTQLFTYETRKHETARMLT